ncbi:hypothetical protein ABFX02_10G150500 [Erythranthe guttata]
MWGRIGSGGTTIFTSPVINPHLSEWWRRFRTPPPSEAPLPETATDMASETESAVSTVLETEAPAIQTVSETAPSIRISVWVYVASMVVGLLLLSVGGYLWLAYPEHNAHQQEQLPVGQPRTTIAEPPTSYFAGAPSPPPAGPPPPLPSPPPPPLPAYDPLAAAKKYFATLQQLAAAKQYRDQRKRLRTTFAFESVICKLTLYYDYWQLNEVLEALLALLPKGMTISSSLEPLGNNIPPHVEVAAFNFTDDHLDQDKYLITTGHVFRRDPFEMVKILKPGFIRFPGPWEETSARDVIWNFEFLQIAQDLEAEPVWLFNKGVGTSTSSIQPSLCPNASYRLTLIT